jgi:hypothetical protein
MLSSPPRSHRIRARDKLTLKGYFTTDRAPLRARPCGRGDQGSEVTGMIKVTRDQAKLRGFPFIRFRTSYPSEGQPFGAYSLHYLDKRDDRLRCSSLPIEQLFTEACLVAKQNGVSAILIDDPDRRFNVDRWVRQGMIKYLDDRS